MVAMSDSFTVTLVSCREAELRWSLNQPIDAITITVQSNDRPRMSVATPPVHWVFHVAPSQRGEFHLPLRLHRGRQYRAHLLGLSAAELPGGVVGYQPVSELTTSFRAELTYDELVALYQRALRFMASRGALRESVCAYMTRNKPFVYYEDIRLNHRNIMKPYIKDNNGDPASVINNQINGLFFGTAVDKTSGLPPLWSHFGPQRLNVPPHLLLTPDMMMYFADFYCNHKAHYVTLVVAHRGSLTQQFLQDRLPQMDLSRNPLLYIQNGITRVTQNVWVELLYTDAVDITSMIRLGAVFNTVESTGTSRPDGIPKNPSCTVCNLYMDPD